MCTKRVQPLRIPTRRVDDSSFQSISLRTWASRTGPWCGTPTSSRPWSWRTSSTRRSFSLQRNHSPLAVVVKINGIPCWGRCTTHSRTYLSDWIGMFTGGTWFMACLGFRFKASAYGTCHLRVDHSSGKMITLRSFTFPDCSGCAKQEMEGRVRLSKHQLYMWVIKKGCINAHR